VRQRLGGKVAIDQAGAAGLEPQLVDDRAADRPGGAILAIDAGVDVQDGYYCLLGMDSLPRHPK
jgi:hypothetical protein